MNQTQLIQLLMDQSKDLFWMIDLDFRLLYANKRYLNLMKEMTGVEKKLNESVLVEGFGEGYIIKWKAYYTRALQGEFFEIEEHFYHPESNEIQYNQVTFEPLTGDDQKVFAVACRSKDITRIVKQRSEANQLLDASLDVFCTLNEQGNFVHVSAAALNHWGYLPSEMIGRPYQDFILEEDVPKTNEIAAAILSGLEVKSFVNRCKKKDGGIAYNLWSTRWDDFTKLMYAVARDGKEKIEQEEKILQSEQRFKALVQEGSDLIGILDAEGKYIYVSPTSTSILGMAPEEFIGRSPFEFIHPEDAERVLSSLQKISIENKVTVEPFRFRNDKNEWRWIETVLTNMVDNPAVMGIVANSRDITAKIEEQHQLKLLESVITNTNDAVLITEAEPQDEPGPKIIYVNAAFTKMTGYTADEVIGKSPRMLQGPNSNIEDLAKLGRALRNWEPYEITTTNYKKSGEEFWINFTVIPVADEKGWYTHWIAIERDVTEKKNKEREKDLINEISKIFNESTDNDLSACLTRLCEHIAKFGYFDFAEIWLPAIDAKTINRITTYAEGKAGNTFYEATKDLKSSALGEGMAGYVWENKTTEIWGNVEGHWLKERKVAAKKAGIGAMMGVPLKHKEEVIGVLLVGTVKTKSALALYSGLLQKLELSIGAELSRKKIEIELAQIFDFTPGILCVAGFDGYLKRINPAGLEILGYTLEEMRSQPIRSFVHEEDRLQTKEQQINLYNGGRQSNFENRYITKQGKIVWLNWSATSAPEHGIVYAVAKNITEEKKLRELNRQAGSLAKIGSWEVDLINQRIFWSDEVHQLHETDPKSFVPNLATAINFYREDFRQLVNQSFGKSATTGEPFDFEAVLVTAKKKELWVRTIGNAEFLNKQCTRIYGSFQDIDERKRFAIILAESENRFRTILEAEPECIKLLGPGGELLMMNPAGLAMIEADSEEQVIGKSMPKLLLPKHRSAFLKLTKNIFKGESGKLEFEIEGLKGTRRWLETHAVPLKNEEGEIISLLSVTRDITERKKAEERILKANERFEKVTEATNDVIWDWDMVTQTYYRSKAIERFFGTNTSKSFTTKDFWEDKFHPEDITQLKDSIQEAIGNPFITRWEQEYRVFNEQGKTVYVIDRGVIIRNKEGKAIRMVGAMTDVTEQKQMTLQLSELNQSLQQHTLELERSNEELEQFAFVVSHDLQEPLRMISSFMDQLMRKYKDRLDEKGHLYIHFATDGAKKMKKIILDLLDYSRAGKIEEKDDVDMNEVFSEFKQLRRKLISEKAATISSNHLPTLNTYRAAITQILHCLLDNALKYSIEGIPPIVEVDVVENEKEWEFSIKDNGIGIDSQFFEKIFVIFQRLHNKDEYGGTGIGLSIAKRHILFLGGQIWLESKPKEGTVFYFTIPKIN